MDVTLEGNPGNTVTLSRELAEFLYAHADARLADLDYPGHLVDTLDRARRAIRSAE